jgi:transposase InsO family protein
MLPHYNISAQAIIEIKGAPHKYLGHTIPGRNHLMHAVTGAPYLVPGPDGRLEMPTDDQLDEGLICGDIVIKEPTSLIEARRLAREAEWDSKDCEELTPKCRKMLAQCRLLDDNGIQNGIKAIGKALATLWTEELQSQFGDHDNVHSIKRWRTQRGKVGDRNERDMVNMSGKVPRAPYFQDVPHEVIQKAALRFYTNRGTYKDAWSEACEELRLINQGRSDQYPQPRKPYKIPSYATVYRACCAIECAATIEARDGKQAVQADWRGAGKALRAGRALELGIIDHTPIPGYCVIDPEREMVVGQPWLSTLMDVSARAILAHVISYLPPSVWTVGELIKRANLPKRPPRDRVERYPCLRRICGKSAEIIVDNAPEFMSQALEDAAKSAGFAIRRCPIKRPTYRAFMERFYQTIWTLCLKRLPGAARPIKEARKLGYDPEKAALVTVNELEAVMNAAIALYHIEPHEGLQNRQPLLVFEKSVNKHGIDLVHDIAGFQREIMDMRSGVQLSKSGVRMFSLRYHDPRAVPVLLDDLVPLECKRQRREEATATVKVKFDPSDISLIHVWNRRTRKYVTLRCADETYSEGMPLWFHKHLVKLAREEAAAFNTEEERCTFRTEIIAAIRNISPEAKHQEREIVARLHDIPRIRQITGNLVHLHTEDSEAVSVENFIAHDLAATTALDDEILAPRPAPRAKAKPRRDRRDAGQPKAATRPTRRQPRPNTRRVAGGYE